MDIWEMIRYERAGLADLLDTISEKDWATPSLCTGWTVRDVVAHVINPTFTSGTQFVAGVVTSGFSLDRFVEKGIARQADGRTNPELLERFKSRIDSRDTPLGRTEIWLGETVIHGEDITRALGIPWAHKVENLIPIADFYKGTNMVLGAKKRIAGVRLVATDADWTHGEGREASGPMAALVMAMSGRKAALDDLTGPGAANLADRMP